MLVVMDEAAIRHHLRRQRGVISRRQVLDAGGDDLDIARLLRRREWARLHLGVYVDHTGVPSRQQREWAAVLYFEPAALAGRSALRAHGVATEDSPMVEVAIEHGRRIRGPAGTRCIQLRNYADLVLPNASPPRLKLEPAALILASRAPRDDAAVGVLADVVRGGHTTPPRLRRTLDGHLRLPRRRLLGDAVADVAAGAESPLERRYLRDVERAHGLPGGERQVREETRLVRDEVVTVVRRDCRYRPWRTLLELDGDLHHSAALDRWADLSRDLAAAVAGDLTLRAGWPQVLDPCRLAAIVATVLRARGWTGRASACARPGCVAGMESAA